MILPEKDGVLAPGIFSEGTHGPRLFDFSSGPGVEGFNSSSCEDMSWHGIDSFNMLPRKCRSRDACPDQPPFPPTPFALAVDASGYYQTHARGLSGLAVFCRRGLPYRCCRRTNATSGARGTFYSQSVVSFCDLVVRCARVSTARPWLTRRSWELLFCSDGLRVRCLSLPIYPQFAPTSYMPPVP